MCCLDYWVCVATWTRIASQSFLVCNNLPILKLCPSPYYFRGRCSRDSSVSSFCLPVSVSISVFIRCLNAEQCGLSSNRNAGDTGPAAVPPHPSPSPSPGLLLYTEGNKDTRRISVVCLTKWLPESERAMPMGSTAALLCSAPLGSVEVPPPHCSVFPKVRSLSGSSVDVW